MHKIKSDKSLVVQIIHMPLILPNQGVDGFGMSVPCIQWATVKPSVTLSPIAAGGGSYVEDQNPVQNIKENNPQED